MTPGSTPLTLFVADVIVYAPGPVPTVSWASLASVNVVNPPTTSLNALASMFSPLFAPAVFDVIWSRYVLRPTCTAVAVTPAFARVDVAHNGREAAVAGAHVVAVDRAGAQPAGQHAGDRAGRGVEREALAGIEAREGLGGAVVDLQGSVGAGVHAARRSRDRGAERVPAGDLERGHAAFARGGERQLAGAEQP